MATPRVPLADVDALSAWLGEAIEDGSTDEARAGALLARASEIVRVVAARTWLDDDDELVDDVPHEIQGVVVELAASAWFNVAGWANAGFAGFTFTGDTGMDLTAAQRATVLRYREDGTGGTRGIGVVSTTRDEQVPADPQYWVPTVGGPLFPWW